MTGSLRINEERQEREKSRFENFRATKYGGLWRKYMTLYKIKILPDNLTRNPQIFLSSMRIKGNFS